MSHLFIQQLCICWAKMCHFITHELNTLIIFSVSTEAIAHIRIVCYNKNMFKIQTLFAAQEYVSQNFSFRKYL